jgi:formylglycine-generating enzyme required for sulfatase activity
MTRQVDAGCADNPGTKCAAGMTFKDGLGCVAPPGEMVRIPAGTFTMGEAGASEVRSVTVKTFEFDKTEVTVAQYKACVDAGKCTKPGLTAGCRWESPEGDLYPVACVDWSQATVYCGWAGKRLPTETEWEFAARGTDSRVYPWGNDPPDRQRICMENLNGCPVGTRPAGASPFGVLDLGGNVAEWTESVYCVSGIAGSKCADRRLVRGQAWRASEPAVVRAAARTDMDPTTQFASIGFRCAR